MTKKDFKEAIKQTLKQIPEDYTITSVRIEEDDRYRDNLIILAVDDTLKSHPNVMIAKSPLSYSHTNIKYK
jgi:hypothetical protein